VIGPRTDWTSLAARNRILLLLDRAYPEDEARDAIVLVDL
jgi:hypothetical protein